MALLQRRVERETGWTLAQSLPTSESYVSRQNQLMAEFGGEAKKDWWDPAELGGGQGRPVGVREIAARLEQAAADHVMFAPRFAGGKEPMLARMELAAHKWFSQFLHHTATGLPVQPMPAGDVEPTQDPGFFVAFTAGWLFAQQVFLMHDLYREGTWVFDHLFGVGLMEGYGASSEDLDWQYTYGDEDGTLSPAAVAVQIWGAQHMSSDSPGARRIRELAQEAFPEDTPGHAGDWRFNPAQVERIQQMVQWSFAHPPGDDTAEAETTTRSQFQARGLTRLRAIARPRLCRALRERTAAAVAGDSRLSGCTRLPGKKLAWGA